VEKEEAEDNKRNGCMDCIRKFSCLCPFPMKGDRNQVMRLVLPMICVQEFLLIVMWGEASSDEKQFYQV
jgi:hypothetical protein